MLYRKYFPDYERMSKKILGHRVNPPLSIVTKYEKVLNDLREHLYANKVKMLPPKYPYDPEDITTHAYIRDPDSPAPIPNPAYKYRFCWKRIDGKKGIG